MDDNKIEVNLTVCRGCLSSDRTLLPLKQNFDLFTLLLNDGMIYNDLKYFNTYFCWECTALLRRMKEFQKRIQKAQHYFDNFLTENQICLNKECLSTLNIVKNDYVEYIYYTELPTDLKTEASLKCNNPVIQHVECTIKEENFDDKDNDNDIPNLNDDDFDDITNEKKKSTKKCKVKKEVETNIKNKDEKDKIFSRMTKVEFKLDSGGVNEKVEMCTFSFKEVEAMKKRKRCTWKIVGFNNKANLYIKYLQSLRKKDELQSSKTADTNITCSSCKSSVPTTEISQHWDAHIITLYKCKYCPYYGKTIGSDFADHCRRHTIMYKCNECWMQYSALKEFYSHYKNMHQRAQCDYCGIKARYKKIIEKHIKNHHTPSTCAECNRTYTNYQLLRRHTQTVHPTVKRECYCVECDTYFKSSVQYRYHLTTTRKHRIKPVKKIPCPECGKEFTRKEYMKKHYQLTHQNQTKHYCELCDKHFFSSYGLRRHRERVHLKIENPKNKLCPFCGRGFSANQILVQHIRTHTGERPYKCSVCNAAYAQKYAMQQHEKKQHKKY